MWGKINRFRYQTVYSISMAGEIHESGAAINNFKFFTYNFVKYSTNFKCCKF